MNRIFRRGAALALALAVTAGAAGAAASDAMGWEIHKSGAPLSPGAGLGKNIFWSDSLTDLRTEHYVSYTPNPGVLPTVAYGDKVLTRATLSEMAAALEGQGKRVVSGVNGDWYVLATGAPTGLVVSDGVVRSTPYYDTAWAVGFNADGTAFIGRPGLTLSVSYGGVSRKLSGGLNKVRKLTASDTSGGLTLLTCDFSAMTQNTEAGVDVILAPYDDGTGLYAAQPRVGRQTQYVVEQVLESAGSIAIPEGKAVLTMNAKDDAGTLAELRALQSGDVVTLTVAAADARWSGAVHALGGVDRIVADGQAASGLPAERTACTAVGIKADGSVLFYTVDGKQPGYSVGATMTQVAQRLVELGCVEAVSMDGGGSTNLGAAYPGQSGMQVVTSPSDGKERANSTALFLTSTLQPTGELASYYVTPRDALLLSGASVSLSAAGLDTNYFPTAGDAVDWSVEGGGTVDAGGVFTAGGESGFSLVTASDGWASGSAYLTTVSKPDSIRLTREDTGAAVTALNLDPLEQVDLKATAVYRKLALAAQDANFTWSCDPAVGSVDENGLFTAGEKTASGELTVSAGGTELRLSVSIAGHVHTLEDCESDLYAFAATDTAAFGAETAPDYVHNGRQSLRVQYDASADGSASLTGVLPIPAGERYLGVWVYGDGSGNTLLANAVDGALQSGQFLLTALDFTGWRHVSVPLPEGAVSLSGIEIVYGGGEGAQAGMIWLDQFTTSNEEMHDESAPRITVAVSGAQLTATVQDDVDRSIPQGSVRVTYDGAELAFTWNEAAGTLSATLPAADAGYHRVSVTASDASGNLARAGADIQPAVPREPVFTDTAEHWCAPYAVYLYDTGVSTGITSGAGLLFQPDKSITRAEFFTMIARWLKPDLTQYAGVELSFADAGEIPDWALGEVKAMYGLGLLKGAAENGVLKCNAQATISRAEALTILGRTQARGYAAPDLTGDDAALVPDWAAYYVKTLAGQGVADANGVRPNDLLTRGELAKMLYFMQ